MTDSFTQNQDCPRCGSLLPDSEEGVCQTCGYEYGRATLYMPVVKVEKIQEARSQAPAQPPTPGAPAQPAVTPGADPPQVAPRPDGAIQAEEGSSKRLYVILGAIIFLLLVIVGIIIAVLLVSR